MKRLELSRPKAPAPEAGVSTIPPHPHTIYFNSIVFNVSSGLAPGHDKIHSEFFSTPPQSVPPWRDPASGLADCHWQSSPEAGVSTIPPHPHICCSRLRVYDFYHWHYIRISAIYASASTIFLSLAPLACSLYRIPLWVLMRKISN